MPSGILRRVKRHHSTNSSGNFSRFVPRYLTLQSKFTQHCSSYLKFKLVQICQINLQSQCFLVAQWFSGLLLQWFQVQRASSFFIVQFYFRIFQIKFVFSYPQCILYFEVIWKTYMYFFNSSLLAVVVMVTHAFSFIKKINIHLFELFMALILFQFEHLVV